MTTNDGQGRGISKVYNIRARQRARGETQKNAKSKIKRKNQRNQNQYEVLKGRATVLFEFAGNQNNQNNQKIKKEAVWQAVEQDRAQADREKQ